MALSKYKLGDIVIPAQRQRASAANWQRPATSIRAEVAAPHPELMKSTGGEEIK